MTATDIRGQSLRILRTLRDAGFESYWAGGCVRDLLLGREAKDFDIATRAEPAQVRALFPHTLDVGAAYGVIHVVVDKQAHEVTTFRREADYKDGRRPEAVEFCEAREDAQRRDFTINGLFYDPDERRVLDYVNGQADLEKKLVRAIGPPEQRFAEDYLRMLRGVRLAATLSFRLDPATAAAIRTLRGHIAHVSAERVQQELSRLLLEAPRAGQGLLLLRDAGLLDILLPEVSRLAGQEQPPAFHPEGDVLTHTVQMLDAMEKPTLSLALSVLLHDVGKPPTATLSTEPDGSERIRFNAHASVGADLTEEILRRLKYPVRVLEDVAHMVRNHMRFIDVQNMRRATLRRLAGAPTFETELELHRLDCLCSHGDLSNYRFLCAFLEEMKSEPVLPKPWVSGHDLLEMGIPEGRRVGLWHKKVYEAQLEGLFSSREALLAWLRTSLSEVNGES